MWNSIHDLQSTVWPSAGGATMESKQMQKLIASAALALASLITVHFVFGANVPDLPKGIGANNWMGIL